MDAILNNIKIQRGEILTLICTVYPSPSDITGWNIVFRMKNNYGDAAYVLSKTGVLTAPLTGEFSFTFANLDTDRTPRTYVYDIWRTDGGSEVCLGKGDFVIDAEVTY